MERNINASLPVSEGLFGMIRSEIEKRKKSPSVLLLDALVFGLVLLFSRWHIAFGTYPLAVSFIAATPSEIWIALLAAVVGSMTRGTDGAIYAMIAIIVVFLRVLISGGESKNGESRSLFSEPLILRLAVSLIGAFIGAVYELLLGGINNTGILYSIASCLFGVAFTILFYGMLSSGVGFFDLVFGRSAIFESKRDGAEKYRIILFQAATLVVIFVTSLAASEYSFLGINLEFVIAGVITLFTAKRFGAVRAMAVGFVATLGTSGIYSVAFALLGLVSGLLFTAGHIYAFLGGAAAVGAWSTYMGGLNGLLSTMPEFACSLAVFFPFLRLLPKEIPAEISEDFKKAAADMVSSMALSHRNERGGGVDRLSLSIGALSSVIRRFASNEDAVSLAETKDFLIPELKETCMRCPEYSRCILLTPAPGAEIIDEIGEKIHKNSKVLYDLESFLPEYCTEKKYLIDKLSGAYGEFCRTRYKSKNLTELSEEYELISKLINEARTCEEREWVQDSSLTERLSDVLSDAGISDGFIRAYGERKKRFIAAGRDVSGELISSSEFLLGISKASGFKLGTPEFYRKGELALVDCQTAPLYAVDFAKSSVVAPDSSVSGDTAASFVSGDSYFYSLLSDGAGSGELAKLSSVFVSEFLSNMLSASVSDNTALSTLNHIIRRRGEDCAATLDLFRFDLLRGEAVFIKSGAAVSYVKRENSLFRIRSESAPLGLLKNIDSERIRVECMAGDLVVMLSDGVCGADNGVAWLPEFLAKPFSGSLSEYADAILNMAKKNSNTRDDMTVSLAKIRKIS